ncbi:DUF2793 domain-containing protein [Paragemmobacter ruber]|uniref:DUF2793 domain-containing protein n=1 Tax=Paragemmobacter ruber TaxID=1985673 RepID=UPI00191BDD86|nr:DUF2793 domain-containing protein [Rhodobacter ruber]
MSDDTPLLSLPLILPAQAQKHVTHNEALRLLDLLVQLAVIDRTRTTPPALPAEGDRHIVAAPASGLWAGQEGKVAAFWGGAWAFLAPRAGWLARVLAEDLTLAHDGAGWGPAQTPPETLPRLGIAATADATNRLAVSAPAALFDHAGQGHQIKVNKASPADTASLLFQTAYSGRAEMGLAGTDGFALRVSGTGAAFTTALATDAATATVALPEGLIAAPLVLRDPADPAKRATLDITPLTAGSQRAYTLPNASTELAGLAGTQTFTGAKSFSGTFNVSAGTATFGSGTGNATYGLGSGATGSGGSKSINIGTSGAAGSTTTLTLGPANAAASGSTTIHGTTLTLGPTLAQFDMGAASARAAQLGIGGATGDATNRLSVSGPGVLFTHAGAGVEATVNKSGSADTAQISFKTGFSTRAQFGLLGSDDLGLSVSANGAAFQTVFTADAATGRLTLAQPLFLQGAADPASPPDGLIWHHAAAGQIRARLGGQTLRLDGQQEIAWLTPPAGELVLTTTGVGGGATTTLAGAAGRIDLFPFLPRADLGIDRLVLNATTAVAGALARVLVYASDANGRPDGLILETGDLDLGTTGTKSATVGLTLRQGRCYWLGTRHSSTATTSAWALTATPDLNGGTAPATTARKVLRRTVAWANPAPATWGYAAAEISATTAPAIWLRMA